MVATLQIHNDIKTLLPPLTPSEYAGLEADILKNGCISPLATWRNTLIDGHHRYNICQQHNIPFETIELDFNSLDDAKLWAWQHQKNRRNVTLYALGEMALKFKPVIAEKARANMVAGGVTKGWQNSANPLETRKEIADMAGTSHDTISRIEYLDQNADDLTKEKLRKGETSINAEYKRLKSEFDDADKNQILLQAKDINSAIRETKRAEVLNKINTIAQQHIITADGLYDCIVIDPPWPIKKIEREVTPTQVEFDYPTMTLEEIADLSIPAADDSHIFLWATQKYLPHAFDLLTTWDFKYVCTFTWHKNGGFQPFGLPQYNSEFCLYARKGSPKFIDTADFSTCFSANRTRHSEKPECFYNTIARVTGGRRLDMFSRRFIPGFDAYGNEANN